MVVLPVPENGKRKRAPWGMEARNGRGDRCALPWTMRVRAERETTLEGKGGKHEMSPEENDFLEEMYQKHRDRLLRCAQARLRSSGQAQDIVQDVFHEAVNQIGTFLRHPNPVGWLMEVLRRKLLEHERWESKYLKYIVALDESYLQLPGREDIPGEALEERESAEERREKVARIRERLTPEEFHMIWRFAVEGASHLELAKELGITVWTSQKRISRTKRKIQDMFPDE